MNVSMKKERRCLTLALAAGCIIAATFRILGCFVSDKSFHLNSVVAASVARADASLKSAFPSSSDSRNSGEDIERTAALPAALRRFSAQLSTAGQRRLRKLYAPILSDLPPIDRATGRRQWHPEFKNPCWKSANVNHSISTRSKGNNSSGAALRCLPYFYVLAPSKSASTFLWRALAAHPQVAGGDTTTTAAARKEYHFWTAERNYNGDPSAKRQTASERAPGHALPQMAAQSPSELGAFWGQYTGAFARILQAAGAGAGAAAIPLQRQQQIVTGDASTSTFWCIHGWGCPPGHEPDRVVAALGRPRLSSRSVDYSGWPSSTANSSSSSSRSGITSPSSSTSSTSSTSNDGGHGGGGDIDGGHGGGGVLVPQLLREAHPGARLVVLLRDPVERFRSDHFFFKVNPVDAASPADGLERQCLDAVLQLTRCMARHGSTRDPFFCLSADDSVNAREDSQANTNSGGRCDPCRLAPGFYSAYLQLWQTLFPGPAGGTYDGTVAPLVVLLPELRARPRATIGRILSYLDLDPFTEAEWRQLGIGVDSDPNHGASGRGSDNGTTATSVDRERKMQVPAWGRDTHQPGYDLTPVMRSQLKLLYKPFDEELAQALGVSGDRLWH